MEAAEVKREVERDFILLYDEDIYWRIFTWNKFLIYIYFLILLTTYENDIYKNSLYNMKRH